LSYVRAKMLKDVSASQANSVKIISIDYLKKLL